MKLPVNTIPWIQGAVVGAVAVMVIGFTWGGWVTGGTASKQAAEASRAGTVNALTSVCADRFRAQPDATTKLKELSQVSTWERGDTVGKSGFATMPGQKSPDRDVSNACAESLVNAAVPKT